MTRRVLFNEIDPDTNIVKECYVDLDEVDTAYHAGSRWSDGMTVDLTKIYWLEKKKPPIFLVIHVRQFRNMLADKLMMTEYYIGHNRIP